MDNVTTLVQDGFLWMVLIVVGVTTGFGLLRMLIIAVKSGVQKSKKKSRKGYDPNKWEAEWQIQKLEESKRKKALTGDAKDIRKKELAKKRESYRRKRHEERWTE